MKNSVETQNADVAASKDAGFSPWQQLKTKKISYLTLPLLFMATVVEFVILATGWKYQQMVCLPQGMGVTFFGIGPIGATILAVELLKLPLAIWTASRTGWQKGFMLLAGLPLICVLTFQLVKDMAVYEMGTAMAPAAQMLEKASIEEVKINHLNGDLAAIEAKKSERERKLTELNAKKIKAKADLEEALKRNDEQRQDAITLTDYQKKELAEEESRQAAITKQYNADADQLTKTIADLRARREAELPNATAWNAEEARIENSYKARMTEYANKKKAYEKDKAEYDSASFLVRQVLREPIDPGVPPEREVNTILKPTLLAELDSQIKAKEAELLTVNNKRRERIAQVGDNANRLRQEFDVRSRGKREEADRKREELLSAHNGLLNELKAEEKQIDAELAVAVQKVDGLRAEVDAARKKAESYYEAREAAIRNTQVHRIATTVEIVRGLIFGERPMSITATAKQRGDILTDQISMVRIWVYPVLAFIVAFLPTLMVEIGFSTVFKPEQQRPPHRLGFFGRGLHQLYIRAGRQKILRAERLANEAVSQIATRDKALIAAKIAAEKAQAEKTAEVRAAQEAVAATARDHEEQLKQKEAEWVAKFTDLADSLNRAVVEKDALRDLQRSEIERQVQMRQNAWSERITQLRKELDDQRNAFEAERTVMMQDHQQKLLEVTESCKTQVVQARRQMADAELAAVEKTAKLASDLKEALHARDAAESQLKHQSEFVSRQLTQAQEDAAREVEKAVRQEKHRFDRQQADFEKTLREREEDFDHKLKQREQELTLAFETRLTEEKAKADQEVRRREAESQNETDARITGLEARFKQEMQQLELAAQKKLAQREQQLQAEADVRLRDAQAQAEEQLRRRESELERQLDTQSRQAVTRQAEELQRQELAFHSRLKQREQELAIRAAAREAELQNQAAADLRTRQEEWEQQAQARVRAAETRFAEETHQKEAAFQQKLRQHEQQLQSEFDAREAELRKQWDQDSRRRDAEAAEAKQREQELMTKLNAATEAHESAEKEWETELIRTRSSLEPLKALLVRTEKERDEARHVASEGIRRVQDLKKKTKEASSLLNAWDDRDHLAGRMS